MNFFERQQQARTSSRRLVFLFALAVIGIVLAIDAAVWFALGATELSHEGMSVDDPRIAIIIVVSLLTLAVIGISSLVRIAMLRGGGAEVARSMGATPVSADTTEPSLRRLRNVVEEIAIASSTPVPDIYVMEEEEGINAFAAGYSPKMR